MEAVLDRVEDVEIQDNGFPTKVWVIGWPDGTHGCANVLGVGGLAVGTHEGSIIRFAEFLDEPGGATQQISFEEACALALGKSERVKGLVLVDNIRDMKIILLR